MDDTAVNDAEEEVVEFIIHRAAGAKRDATDVTAVELVVLPFRLILVLLFCC